MKELKQPAPAPRIFVSRCLGFEKCRWNGEVIHDETVERLALMAREGRVELFHDCPEMGIGLGCPRDPVRVVRDAEAGFELYQPATGARLGESMRAWSRAALEALPEVDGFILKSRSPSCGFKDVKIHDSFRPEAGAKPGAGIFGAAVIAARPGIPVEDEGRLKNFALREHFLGAAWTLARFRAARETGTMGALVAFHSRHKLFLLLHNQKEMRLLGKVVANLERKPAAELWPAYRSGLERALAAPPRYGSLVNAIQHAFGGFSESLSAAERKLFEDSVTQYMDERIPASVLLRLVHSWAVRFGEAYLLEQVLFEPYPFDLVDLADSGRGRLGTGSGR